MKFNLQALESQVKNTIAYKAAATGGRICGRIGYMNLAFGGVFFALAVEQ